MEDPRGCFESSRTFWNARTPNSPFFDGTLRGFSVIPFTWTALFEVPHTKGSREDPLGYVGAQVDLALAPLRLSTAFKGCESLLPGVFSDKVNSPPFLRLTHWLKGVP